MKFSVRNGFDTSVTALLMVIAVMNGVTAPGADPISFNDDIRPIFADRCFKCHGPDSATRQAGLRLDQEAVAKNELEDTGNIPIVSGQLARSELFARLVSTDPDQQMPPPDSKLAVTHQEIALIKQWIEEGAPWQRHWSFIVPQKSELPAIKDRSWPSNEIDYFVLQRLEASELQPTRPADREHLLRRITFALTGLPPTLPELDAFLSDDSNQAYEHAVDRLLSSPAFGERMAQEWLDVARYGDTDGLFEDHPRSIYPWRDWVIDAFNQNLPYDDFITWQLAGDLLPEATVSQRVATGFLRNNPTSNEGGLIEEDYRVKYLIDRVNTTATAFLGLTLECTQCHDHKYDPMTQREYYQFAGFFNSLEGQGNTKGATSPTFRLYSSEQRTRIAALDEQLATVDAKLATTPAKLNTDFEAWLQEIEQPVTWKSLNLAANASFHFKEGWLRKIPESRPVEEKTTDPVATGRFVRVAFAQPHTGFLTISEVQVFSDGNNVARTGKATQSSVAYNSPADKAIDGNWDGSFASCSCTKSEENAWWEVDLGVDLPIDSVAVWNRTDCCPERLDNITIQILDNAHQVLVSRQINEAAPRNSIPVDAQDTEPTPQTAKLSLLLPPGVITAFQIASQRPTDLLEIIDARLVSQDQTTEEVAPKFDGDTKLALKQEPAVIGVQSEIKVSKGQRLELTLRSVDFAGLRIAVTSNTTAALRAKLPPDRAGRLTFYRDQWPGFRSEREQQAQLSREKKDIETAAPLTMIAGDMATPRTNYVLIRGEYDKRGQVVQTSAPASILAFGDNLPKNRIGLARWLTDRKHPLTARVAVNRYWQMIFGIGIVKTSEDFGTQGNRPSHEKLLDYLAVDFIESGWDVKALIRRLVLSGTYQQSSVVTPHVVKIDPENRLLSHASRHRLQAEFLRDHVLFVSGLLVNKQGGAGVRPYQPAALFGRNAIGAAGAKFSQGTGASLYRRSLYTYWKRQIPAANMRILGADGRTTCRTRREHTNTPLQALVLLNDPQLVEAARVLAEHAMLKGGTTLNQRLSFAFRLATSRRPRDDELNILRQEYTDRLREFQTHAGSPGQYLSGGGEKKPSEEIDQAELAAFAAVASLILNLDESISAS